MKEITVCFLTWHYKNAEVFLNLLRKMTPGKSGKWKNIRAITDPFAADFTIIMDGCNEKYPKDRAIFFCQHPYVPGGLSPSFKDYKDTTCLIAFNSETHLNPGEWWIKHDYDTLMALDNPPKTKNLACIMTHQNSNHIYTQRVAFMKTFSKLYKNYDLYGRPEDNFRGEADFAQVYRGSIGMNNYDGYLGQHFIGKEILADYKYSLEYDVGPTQNYISERFYDAMLLWAMPIYYGSNNVHEYLPKESFNYINIDDLTDINKVISIINSDVRETVIEAIREARNLLLTKYQTWPMVHEIINNIDKYRRK